MIIAWRHPAPGAAFFPTAVVTNASVLHTSCLREVTSAAPVVIRHYTAHWCRRDLVPCASRDHVGPNTVLICLRAGCASVNGPWTERGVLYQHRAGPLLHNWYAIWLPAINKLLRNWKLWSSTAPGPAWPPTGWLSTVATRASLTVELQAARSTENLQSSISFLLFFFNLSFLLLSFFPNRFFQMTQGHFAPTLCYATVQLLIVYMERIFARAGSPFWGHGPDARQCSPGWWCLISSSAYMWEGLSLAQTGATRL